MEFLTTSSAMEQCFYKWVPVLLTTSAVPVQNVPVQNGHIAWPVVLLLAALLRTAHPNNFTVNAVLPWVLSNTPAMTQLCSLAMLEFTRHLGAKAHSECEINWLLSLLTASYLGLGY